MTLTWRPPAPIPTATPSHNRFLVASDTIRKYSNQRINFRVGVVIEHLFLFFIRFHTVPMATDEDVSEPSHLQAAWFRNQIETHKAPRKNRYLEIPIQECVLYVASTSVHPHGKLPLHQRRTCQAARRRWSTHTWNRTKLAGTSTHRQHGAAWTCELATTLVWKDPSRLTVPIRRNNWQKRTKYSNHFQRSSVGNTAPSKFTKNWLSENRNTRPES